LTTHENRAPPALPRKRQLPTLDQNCCSNPPHPPEGTCAGSRCSRPLCSSQPTVGAPPARHEAGPTRPEVPNPPAALPSSPRCRSLRTQQRAPATTPLTDAVPDPKAVLDIDRRTGDFSSMFHP
jgi:hypothetical protein